MTGGWLMDLIVEAAWKSVLVAGAALLLLTLLKRRSAAERACVAHVGMAALLLLPVLVVAGPSLELLPAVQEAPTPAPPELSIAAIPDGAAQAARAPAADIASAPSIDRLTAAAWGYGLPAAIMLLLTLVSILRLFALRGRANVIVQQNWVSALAHAQRRMGIKSGTALLVSEELSSPVSWGVMRPVILLNQDALATAHDAEAIIAHELAHVARFDWLNLLAARIGTALFWFNPLVWLLARLGHQLREEAADDAVLRADVPSTDYAALLVGAARHEGKGLLLAAHGVAPSKGSLSLRVRRILEPGAPRTPARLFWAAGSATAMIAVAAPLAALSPMQPETVAVAARSHPASAGDSFTFAVTGAPPAATALAAPDAPAAPAAAAIAQAPAPVAPPRPVAAPAAPATPTANAPVPPSLASAATAVGAAATAVAHAAVNADPIPPETLVAMRVHGVQTSDVAAYLAAYPRLRGASADQLVSLRVHGISPVRLREYAALGYRDLSPDRLIEWSVHGVSPGFIRGLADAGYRNLSPSRLTEFRIFGITPRFVREVHASGIRNVTAERLVEMRVLGTRPPRTPSVPATGRRTPRPPAPPTG